MNERIKDLEAEAYKYVDSVIHPDAYTTQEQYRWFHRITFNEKFAELMVKKFDDILLLQQLDCIGNKDKKYAELVEQIRTKTKTYFGVEE